MGRNFPAECGVIPAGDVLHFCGGGGTGPQRIGKRKSPNRAIGLGKTRLAKIGMEWIFSGHHWGWLRDEQRGGLKRVHMVGV